MASRKLNTEGIDESLLLASIGKSRQMGDAPSKDGTDNPVAVTAPESVAQPVETRVKSEPARKKRPDYGSTFLKRGELKSRKSVYISKEVHSIISKIVNIIADKEITVGGCAAGKGISGAFHAHGGKAGKKPPCRLHTSGVPRAHPAYRAGYREKPDFIFGLCEPRIGAAFHRKRGSDTQTLQKEL